MTDHKAIIDAELHEVKGAAGASSGTVPVSNGAGSAPFGVAPYSYTIEIHFTDISTAGTRYAAVPKGGTVSKIYSVIEGAIGTADVTLSSTINGVAITDGNITVAYSGSAAGDVDVATPSASNTVAAGDYVSIATDGASTGTVGVTITIQISVA